jgi:hypothetical protein
MKYALLLFDNPANWENVGDDEMRTLHDEYMAVTAAPESYGGAQLQPVEQGKTVRRPAGGDFLVTDGPFAETKEVISGFYLVEADSEERALELAKQIPTVSRMGGAIEVRPIVER